MTPLIETIEKTIQEIDGLPDERKMVLINQLVALTKKLVGDAVAFSHIPHRFQETIFPAMEAQLQAAEKRTEKAADDIMSVAETMMTALPAIEGEAKKTMQDGVNKIFEASTFQDLVAQHINEIRLLLKDLNEDMNLMAEHMGDGTGKEGQPPIKSDKNRRPDAHLLNGPTTNF